MSRKRFDPYMQKKPQHQSSRQGKLLGQKILQADADSLIQQFDLPL